jgi:hypothetical protein
MQRKISSTHLNKGELEFRPVGLWLHNLHVNLYCLQNIIRKATIHLFNLLLLLVYIPFSAALLASWCQVHRPFNTIPSREMEKVDKLALSQS